MFAGYAEAAESLKVTRDMLGTESAQRKKITAFCLTEQFGRIVRSGLQPVGAHSGKQLANSAAILIAWLASNSRLKVLETKLDNVSLRTDRVESRLDQIEARMDRLETKLDRLDDRVRSLELFNAGSVKVPSS